MGFLIRKTCFFSKNENNGLKKQKKQVGLFSFKKKGFSQPCIFQSFCDFPLIARPGTSHITISLIG